jgi:hypothetical protein
MGISETIDELILIAGGALDDDNQDQIIYLPI